MTVSLSVLAADREAPIVVDPGFAPGLGLEPVPELHPDPELELADRAVMALLPALNFS